MRLWTPTHDAAIALGSGLGMSCSRVALALGPDFTRNMVIGRANRIGLHFFGASRYGERKPSMESKLKPRELRFWTEEEDAILREKTLAGVSRKDIGVLLGRPAQGVGLRRKHLGITFKRHDAYSPEEDAIIRADYAAHVPMEVTAAKLRRSFGSLCQHIMRLRLFRDNRKTRLANRYGVEALSLSDDPNEIRRQLKERDRLRELERRAAEAFKVKSALDDMVEAIASGADRVTSFRAALLQGATLQQVGDCVGLTRERVRQLADPNYRRAKTPYEPKPPRDITCIKCGNNFKGNWNRKYCDPCREIRKEETRAYLAAYVKNWKAEHQERARRSNNASMGRSYVVKKFMGMSKEEQAKILASLASRLGGVE
jgi:hypothetical protein